MKGSGRKTGGWALMTRIGGGGGRGGRKSAAEKIVGEREERVEEGNSKEIKSKH